MGFSVVGLMDSKVFLSTPCVNSPLMKLEQKRLVQHADGVDTIYDSLRGLRKERLTGQWVVHICPSGAFRG